MLQSPAMRSNAGIATRQGDVDLRFAKVSTPPVNTLAWVSWNTIHSFIHLESRNRQQHTKKGHIKTEETTPNFPAMKRYLEVLRVVFY